MRTSTQVTVCLIGFVWLVWFPVVSLALAPVTVKSPNGAVRFSIRVQKDQLSYSIFFQDKAVVEPSSINIAVDNVNLGEGATLGKAKGYTIQEEYATRGVHASALNYCNGATIPVRHKGSNTDYLLEVRVFNDGIGYRFIVPSQGVVRTPDEATTFTFPAGSTVWYHDLYWHYEGIHAKKAIAEVPIGDWAAPPLTVKLPNGGGYASVSEAALMNYPGMALQANGRNGFVTRLGHAIPNAYPFAHDYKMEDAIRLAMPAAIKDTITTPWRTVTIGANLNDLVNSDLITNLVPAPDKKLFPEGLDTDWIKPGRSVWTWLDGGERTVEGMKEFSKLAGQLGFEYNTVDAFWSRWTDEQLKDLVSYSEAQGVKIWLWQHGRHIKDREQRRKFFRRCQELGVAGVKLDAFSHESKEFIDLYQDCLRDAAEFKLMVNFHGNNKPAGEARTWPNEMTREGIRGLEYGRSQANWAQHNATLPFTRLLAGHGDYTPVVFGERRLDTSWAHQIGTAIVFTSPALVYGAHPQNLLDNPAVDLIKNIPSVWDETIVLPGSEIGEIAAFARRSGDNWFLAVLNGESERNFQLPLSFLGEGLYQATIAKDHPQNSGTIKMEKAFSRSTDTLPVYMRGGGGFVVRFVKNGSRLSGDGNKAE